MLDYKNKQEKLRKFRQVEVFKNMQDSVFRFKLYINYMLHSEMIYLAICLRMESKMDWTVVNVRAREIMDMK